MIEFQPIESCYPRTAARQRRITREAMDELAACLPVGADWGDPITPELAAHIIEAAGRIASDRAAELGHGYSVGDRVKTKHGERGRIRVINNPRHLGDQCMFLIELDADRPLGRTFWVHGDWHFTREAPEPETGDQTLSADHHSVHIETIRSDKQ